MRTTVYGQSIILTILLITVNTPALADQNIVIKGKLIDNLDRNVSNGEITIVDADGGLVKSAASDSLGKFIFADIERGYFSFEIEADGYHTLKIRNYHIDPDTAQHVKIRLLAVQGFECDSCKEGTLSGLLIEDDLINPIGVPGTKVIIDNNHVAISTFDETYKIEDIPSGKYDISVSTLGYSPITIENVELDGDSAYRIDFFMIFGINTTAPRIICY
jgi:hypothetical protein